jgi:hypothetical protein
MKKWIIIVLSIGTLVFLTTRLFNGHVAGIKTEKLWYVENLDFHFSAVVDSLVIYRRNNNGLVYFRKKSGNLRLSKEDILNEKLKYNGLLRFILTKPNDKLAFHSINIDKYQKGDSIVYCSQHGLK